MVFKNRQKKNPKQPDFTGTCLIAGVKMELALWEKASEKAGTFYSFTLAEPREKPPQQERGEGSDPWD